MDFFGPLPNQALVRWGLLASRIQPCSDECPVLFFAVPGWWVWAWYLDPGEIIEIICTHFPFVFLPYSTSKQNDLSFFLVGLQKSASGSSCCTFVSTTLSVLLPSGVQRTVLSSAQMLSRRGQTNAVALASSRLNISPALPCLERTSKLVYLLLQSLGVSTVWSDLSWATSTRSSLLIRTVEQSPWLISSTSISATGTISWGGWSSLCARL